MIRNHVEHFRIPGSTGQLVYERDSHGQLIHLSWKNLPIERVYLHTLEGERVLGDDLVRFSEIVLPDGFLRKGRCAAQTWVERYAWDGSGRLSLVDGVQIERDHRQRVISCLSSEASWRYSYDGERLNAIESPSGRRELGYGNDGRPVLRRNDSRLPGTWHADAHGRLWTVTNQEGEILVTFLWDGFACLGRVDGPPGDPLAAAFSLDPSNTPVRIVTQNGMSKLPRDAFGEALLEYGAPIPQIPGLFGGAIYAGMFHYMARRLDPVIGSYTTQDPWHGRLDDDRRWGGYRGPLPVENSLAGPYTVCQNDPVGRADPLGTNSVLLALSDLTWSYQNNIFSIFGLDLTANFITSLFGSVFGSFGTLFTGDPEWLDFINRFFYFGGVTSTGHEGAFGILRDGAIKSMIPNPAFTFQHLVYTTDEFIQSLKQVRIFAPQADFFPTYYGSILQLAPDGKNPRLLRGDRLFSNVNNPSGLVEWSRSGGTGVAVFPGSRVPVFPAGGMHFNVMADISAPHSGEVVELEPAGNVLLASVDQQNTLVVSGALAGLSAGSLALVTDSTGTSAVVEVKSIESQGSATVLVLQSAVPGSLAAGNLRLRGLGAPSPSESLSLAAGLPDRLNLASAVSTAPYALTDSLRLNQGGLDLAARSVTGFEARLGIDSPLPGGLTAPFFVHVANPQPNPGQIVNVISATQVKFPAAPVPVGTNEAILIGSLPNQVAVVITGFDAADNTLANLDRSIAGAAAPGSNTSWARLGRGVRLGRRDGSVEANPLLTYTPDAIRQAPSSGFLWVEDSSTPARLAARNLTSQVYDGLILDQPAPGNQATAYTVTRFPLQAPDVNGVTSSSLLVLNLPSALGEDVVALQYNQLTNPTLTAGPSVILTGTVAGSSLRTTQAPPPTSVNLPPSPSEVVVLGQGAALALALVKAVRLTVTFDHNLSLTNTDGLSVVSLGINGTAFNATQNTPNQITPTAPAGGALPAYVAGQFVQLNWTGAGRTSRLFRLNAVAGGILTLEGDAPLPAATPSLKVALLSFSGPAYSAFRNAPNQITAQPVVNGQRVQMPRFTAGQLVQLLWVDAGRTTRLCRLSAVDGCVLTLEGDDPLPNATPNLTVNLLDAADPVTGGSRLAIEGTWDRANPRQVTFQSWHLGAFSQDRVVGIIDGDKCFPIRVDAVTNQAIEIEFAAAPPFAGANVNVSQPGISLSIFLNQFIAQGATVTSLPGVTLPAGPGETLAAVTAFRRRGDGVRGDFSQGTTLVPEDLENYELDHHDSLVEHELRHTLQSAYFGPWLLSWFPLFALEGVMEATTGIELPEYSAFVPARLERRGGGMVLSIPNPGSLTFQGGDMVQIALSSQLKTVTLGPGAGTNEFRLRSDQDLPACPDEQACDCFVRKDNHNAWRTFYDSLYFLTSGGLLNSLFGMIYLDGFQGLGKLFYALGNVFGGPGKQYPATVLDGAQSLQMGTPAGLAAVRDAARLIIQSGGKVVVRAKESIDAETVRLSSPIDLNGQVQVAPYDTHTPGDYFDWNDYYPARVPDRALPAKIELLPGSGTLTLEPFDVVTVSARDQSRRTTVMAVNSNLIELEDIPPMDSDDSLRIAKISESDPLGDLDTFQFRRLGLNWLRGLFDPYRAFQYALDPQSGSFLDILARVGRYLFSAKSWSFIPPFFGLWEWDNVFKQANAHLSWMEQDASSQSGDLYSDVGRLRGELSFVGDIARYWYFLSTRGGGIVNVASQGQDRPGLNITLNHRLVPSLDTTSPSSAEPNLGARVNPAVTDPGLDVPDTFYSKNASTPLGTNVANPPGFQSSTLGYIPTSKVLDTVSGVYVAFSRPGQHRATVFDSSNFKSSREAQTEGMKLLGISLGNQAFYFDVNVADVSITVAGIPVATPAAGGAIPRLQLVQTQRATLAVSPNGARRYAVSILNPTSGAALSLPDAMQLQVGVQNGIEPVEISRVHRFTDGKFDGSLGQHGMHLPEDVHIPVRLFEIEVVDTLPVRGTASLDPAQVITQRLPGSQAFVIVPASVQAPLSLGAVTYPGGVVPGIVDPSPGVSVVDPPPAELAAFIGDGAVFRLELRGDDPPQETADMEFRVRVGAGGLNAVLHANLRLEPHFRLVLPGGGVNYQVARGGELRLDLTGGIQPGSVSIAPENGASVEIQGVQVVVKAAAGAGLGARRVLVSDANEVQKFAVRTVQVV